MRRAPAAAHTDGGVNLAIQDLVDDRVHVAALDAHLATDAEVLVDYVGRTWLSSHRISFR